LSNPVASPPVLIDLPVEVTGVDAFGQQFLESTRTRSLQRDGVSILLTSQLAPNSEVIVRNPETTEEAIASVAAQNREGGPGAVYELAFLNPETDLWNIHTRPAATGREIHLQCTGCGSICTLTLSDRDMEMFQSTRELIRSCSTCNASGIWREAGRDARPTKPSEPTLQKESNSSSESSGPPKEDRRKNRRTAMKMAACIRFSGVDLVVDCEDVSKGGFRFKCRNQYPQGTRLEASVPYHEKSSTNIFTPAAVSYCIKMPDGLFRHGVTYVKNGGSAGWES